MAKKTILRVDPAEAGKIPDGNEPVKRWRNRGSDTQVNFRVPSEGKYLLALLAMAEGVSVTEYICRAIASYAALPGFPLHDAVDDGELENPDKLSAKRLHLKLIAQAYLEESRDPETPTAAGRTAYFTYKKIMLDLANMEKLPKRDALALCDHILKWLKDMKPLTNK